ncbi:MAG: methyltransferase domain-containing protein [Nitrospirae bacterium]|nr:methyltransferase domain-containing protein [Nitrospirota bacterium]
MTAGHQLHILNPRQRELLEHFQPYLRGRILDIGCRDLNLARHLPSGCVYVGMDTGSGGTVRATGEGPFLPFKDRAVDVTLAIAVLEHVDDPYRLFGELARITRRTILINLPNLYELSYRIRYLLGLSPNGKYGLPPDPPADRHKWLLSHTEAARFVQAAADRHALTITRSFPSFRRYFRLFERLSLRWPNATVWESWWVLERSSAKPKPIPIR